MKLKNGWIGQWDRPKPRDRVPVDPGIDTMGAESKRNGGTGKLMESSYFARG